MHIVIASIFRDSESYIPRYFNQVQQLIALNTLHGDTTRLVIAEGDSADDTYAALSKKSARLDVELLKIDHGGPRFGSIDNATRWHNISKVCNGVLERIRDDDDVVVYVESDLLWFPESIRALISDTLHYDAVSPICIHLATGQFYDTWGFRKDGICFAPQAPYHPNIRDNYSVLDSAGSCIVMRGEVARACRFNPPELGIVGFGQDIHKHGFSLHLNKNHRVLHP